MLFTDTQKIYYTYGARDYVEQDNYNAQIKFYYEYRPNEQKVYVTNISFTLTKNDGTPVPNPFSSIANINNWLDENSPREQGIITFYVNGQQALQFNFNDKFNDKQKKYYYEQSGEDNNYKNIFFLKKDLLLYQDSFSLPSLSDEVTVKFNTMGLYGIDTGNVRRYLRFYNTPTPIILPINNTYEIKQEGIVGNTNAANDTDGNIRLLYQIRHYNSREDIMYDATPFSPVANQDYLFYKLQIGRGDCREVTHFRIGIGVNDQSEFTSDYTVYPTGNTYLKILVNNIDIIQYLRESIYNATSQSFHNKTTAGTGSFPMYTGKTGSTYETGLTYSGSWYQVFDNLTENKYKIIPQGLYPLTPGTTINITLSCSNIYQHYGYTGGTQSGYYWFSNGGNTCNQFHVPLNPGSNNTATGIFVPTDGCVYIHNGTNFEAYIPYIYNETTSTWEQYLPYIYNGADWELQG